MSLSNEQIQQLVKTPVHSKELKTAIDHHNRLAFQSDVVLERRYASKYINDFDRWIKQLLPDDKVKRVKQLMTFPLATNELMKDIFIGLERVWSAKDFHEKYVFSSEEFELDFMEYLKSKQVKHLWKVEGWSAMKTAIDSVIVVDLPEKQTKERPEPYFYFITPQSIVDISVNELNQCEYVLFNTCDQDGEYLIEYDDVYMRRYERTKKGISPTPVDEKEHKVGHCPARMFWSDKLQDGNHINKKSPCTDSLGDLDWLLFFLTSKKYLDLHAAYPIYVSYELEDDKKDDETGMEKPTTYEGQREAENKGKAFIGAGSFTTLPTPLPGQIDLMANPMQVVSAEIDACEYSVEEAERLAKDIYESCVGADGKVMTKEAVNEKQVEATFKSREEVLLNIARNFASAMIWTHETMAIMRYGKPTYVTTMIDFGEQFYLDTQDELMGRFSEAKEKGVNAVVLDTLEEQLMDNVYRNNKAGRERVKIINDLDPLPGIPIREVAALGVLQGEELQVKMRFHNFIRRFEIEEGSLVDFMNESDYKTKIEAIKSKLLEYGKETNTGESRQ